MSDIANKSLVTQLPPATSRGELVVVPAAPGPTLEERAVQIRSAHADVAAAILTAVERALDAGLHLKAAKDDIGRGDWTAYVARCGLPMRTAQSWMRLARYEAEIRQLVADKAHGGAYLSMPAALKYVARLEAKKKPKRRIVPHSSNGLGRFFGIKR